MLTKLRSKNQITIPVEVTKKMGLHEGAKLDITMTNDGGILITPVVTVNKKWLEEVEEAFKQVKNGEVSKSMNINELIDALDLK